MEQLSRFNSIMGGVYALDNGLRVINYALYILADVAQSSNQHNTDAGKSSDLVGFMLALAGKIGEARAVNRFFGFPATVEGLFGWGNDSSLEAMLGKAMTWSMIAYFPLDHIWYLSTIKPTIFNVDSNAVSQWSCRAWVVYVLLDIFGTVRKIRDTQEAMNSSARNDDKKEKSTLALQLKCLLVWLSICILGDMPLALQYSLENGPFTSRQLNFAGLYGGVAGLYLRWIKSFKQ